jgi:hypothetical protein
MTSRMPISLATSLAIALRAITAQPGHAISNTP